MIDEMVDEQAQRYREFLERLKRDDHRPAALNDIKNLLAFKSPVVAANVIRDVGFSKIFRCLNSTDKVHIDLTCEVLRLCFEKFNPGEIVRNYTGHIMFLLRHEKECVRRLAVDEVYKTIIASPNLLPVPEYIDVFVAVGQMVGEKDVGIANKAILITSHLPDSAYNRVLDEMTIALEYDHSSKCNAFEVITNISSRSPELMVLASQYGYIDRMLSELKTDDVLYQMNILELLSRLAVTPHGINYLVQQGALFNLSRDIVNLKNNPYGGLLTPGYMKFIGSIAHLYPREIFQKYPELTNCLFDTLNSNDPTILPVSLDTLGFVGSTIEAKLCLAALGSKFTSTLDKVGSLIKNSPTEIKVRALFCMASLIGYENDPKAPSDGPIDHRVTLMTREWFRAISSQPEAMELLFGTCKNPFPDIRAAAFSLLDAVCQHHWGEETVARTAGFVEYLLDRSMDHSKESKEAKFDIIKRLSRSAAFDPNVILKLKTYVEQGPFYSEHNLQVAMEEEN